MILRGCPKLIAEEIEVESGEDVPLSVNCRIFGMKQDGRL
jgi:hypothetical protein